MSMPPPATKALIDWLGSPSGRAEPSNSLIDAFVDEWARRPQVTLEWAAELPHVEGLWIRCDTNGLYAVHRFKAHEVPYIERWYPSVAWLGPIPEPTPPPSKTSEGE